MFTSSHRHPWALCALLAAWLTAGLPLSAGDHQHAPAATTVWSRDVAAIADAGNNRARLEAVRRRLQASGFEVTRLPFTSDGHRGVNLFAHVAGDPGDPLLLLGAHADRVEPGEGAVDNASGVAVVLALAERLRERPLAGHRVAVAFWDLEERGLLGAQAYVAGGGEQPALYVNFDVFGWGDTLWMMAPELSDRLVAAGGVAAESAGMGFSATSEHYPPTDHLAFLRAGWPAVSFSLLDADEVDPLETIVRGQQPDRIPRVMRVIHTAEDVRGQLDPEAVAGGLDAVEAALREWDVETGGT